MPLIDSFSDYIKGSTLCLLSVFTLFTIWIKVLIKLFFSTSCSRFNAGAVWVSIFYVKRAELGTKLVFLSDNVSGVLLITVGVERSFWAAVKTRSSILPDWAPGDVPSSMPRCLPGNLRSMQLRLNCLVEMKDRAVCHQHSNGRGNHVLVKWVSVMLCMWWRGGVQ